MRLDAHQEVEHALGLLRVVALVVAPDDVFRFSGSTMTAFTVVEPTSNPTIACLHSEALRPPHSLSRRIEVITRGGGKSRDLGLQTANVEVTRRV